jgi:hypothetical protein
MKKSHIAYCPSVKTCNGCLNNGGDYPRKSCHYFYAGPRWAVSNSDMRKRWRFVLSLSGVTLFVLLTYQAVHAHHEMRNGQAGRYFWWGAIRLDSDPLKKHPAARTQPCEEEASGCSSWDPEYIWVSPGVVERVLILSAFPVFLFCLAVVRGLARLGISEVASFMCTTPVCITVWFYSIGWFLDRWTYKRRARRAMIVHSWRNSAP